MVRQRKSNTRLKKVPAVLADVGREGLSAEGQPEEGRARWRPFLSPSLSPRARSGTQGVGGSTTGTAPTFLGGVVNGTAVAGAPGDLPAEGGLDPGSAEGDEKKKRRGRKKSKLEDMFPPYLQVGWTGGALGVGWPRGPPEGR